MRALIFLWRHLTRIKDASNDLTAELEVIQTFSSQSAS